MCFLLCQKIGLEFCPEQGTFSRMSTFTQIRESAVSLSKPERAELAVLLLGSLDDTHYWVDDEEVDQRSAELDSGAVAGVSKEEFRRLCGR
jgi:hypothetical protein